ncbi:MAG: AAA family ATPase [Proteobacteria bacterium]|nr:AAA family ATPase [Pseudomonadota bacterium]
MQFTKLRLQGFKSFVDPAELVISTGLTGVVGPNGCGKSNILEALRWVMGENRPTAMRGDGMEDVIFAGAESRPARNTASVEIVIDNSERLAPARFNADDTLEISRRVTRDIGSAFTVNGRHVRARDVQVLFADASTGAHSPALVRQGQIGELINAKPTARRRILEEAAGISGLYQRRHEAELKLNAAGANLGRVEEVIEQLDTQLKSLERQAAQARRYRAIAEELRRAEAVLLFLRWRIADQDHGAAERELGAGTRAAAVAETAVQAARRDREAAEAAMPPLRDEEAVAGALNQRLAIERDQLAEREARARAEIEALVGRARQLSIDLEREETLGRDAGGSIERLDQEEASLRDAHAGHDKVLVAAQDAARGAAEQLSEQETALDRLTEEAARLAARATAAERRREEARGTFRRVDEDIARAENAERALAGEIGRVRAALATAQRVETEARTSSATAETALEAAPASQREELTRRLEEAKKAVADSSSVEEFHAELARLERYQAEDFYGIMKAMEGLPVVIRLLDAPLHEFLPHWEELLVEELTLSIAAEAGEHGEDAADWLAESIRKGIGGLDEPKRVLAVIDRLAERDWQGIAQLQEDALRTRELVGLLREANPMMGNRGCRVGLTMPEIYEMQVRAIVTAACRLTQEGAVVYPEIMIPIVSHVNELKWLRPRLRAVASATREALGVHMTYKFGTMIEVPRAALTAGEIAENTEFFSFGSNDLTQMTFAFSRDDAEAKFVGHYVDVGVLPGNPFSSLDRKGVGRLMRIAVEEGRAANPGLPIGICGEHGGDPRSIALCHELGLDYVSASPYRVPVARLAAAQSALGILTPGD